MTLGNLDEYQCDPVWVGHMHLVQAPRFAAGLASDRHASADQLGLGSLEVAHLQPQRAGKRSPRMVRLAVTGQFEQ